MPTTSPARGPGSPPAARDEVFDVRDDAAARVFVTRILGRGMDEAARLPSHVAVAPIPYHPGRNIELCGEHPGRFPHVALEVFLVVHPRRRLDDPVLEIVGVRGVHPPGARTVDEGVVAPQLRRLLERVVVTEAQEIMGSELDAVVMPDPGGVREDVAHRDRERPLRIPGHVGLERRVEIHLPLLHELHETDDGQHLRDRAHVVHRPPRGGSVVLEFSVAHALGEDDLSVHRHRDGQPGQVVVVADLLHVVEQPLVGVALGRQRRRCLRQATKRQKERQQRHCARPRSTGDSHGPPLLRALMSARPSILDYSSRNATTRQNAASPPLNFQGKLPMVSRRFCSSGAAIRPPRFSMCIQLWGKSALCVS